MLGESVRSIERPDRVAAGDQENLAAGLPAWPVASGGDRLKKILLRLQQSY